MKSYFFCIKINRVKSQSEQKRQQALNLIANSQILHKNRQKTVGILTQERIQSIYNLTIKKSVNSRNLSHYKTHMEKVVEDVLVRTPSIGSIIENNDEKSNTIKPLTSVFFIQIKKIGKKF